MKVRPKIENVTLEMIIETGSGLSILPSDAYFRYFHKFKLSYKGVKLKTFDSWIFRRNFGKCYYTGYIKSCNITVAKGGSKILLVRDLIKEFHLMFDRYIRY